MLHPESVARGQRVLPSSTIPAGGWAELLRAGYSTFRTNWRSEHSVRQRWLQLKRDAEANAVRVARKAAEATRASKRAAARPAQVSLADDEEVFTGVDDTVAACSADDEEVNSEAAADAAVTTDAPLPRRPSARRGRVPIPRLRRADDEKVISAADADAALSAAEACISRAERRHAARRHPASHAARPDSAGRTVQHRRLRRAETKRRRHLALEVISCGIDSDSRHISSSSSSDEQ